MIDAPPLSQWNAFQRWRTQHGKRPPGRGHQLEANLYKEAMAKYHGEQWRERLTEPAAEAEEEQEEPGAVDPLPHPPVLALPDVPSGRLPPDGAGTAVASGGGAEGAAPVPRAAGDAAVVPGAGARALLDGASTGSGASSDERTPGDLYFALRQEFDPAMETLAEYRDKVERILMVCTLRELEVNMDQVHERAVRADVVDSLRGMEQELAVPFLKEQVCAILVQEQTPESRLTTKVLIEQLSLRGVELSASPGKVFSGQTTNSSPERGGGAEVTPPATPVGGLRHGQEAARVARRRAEAMAGLRDPRAERIMALVSGASTLEEAKEALRSQLDKHLVEISDGGSEVSVMTPVPRRGEPEGAAPGHPRAPDRRTSSSRRRERERDRSRSGAGRDSSGQRRGEAQAGGGPTPDFKAFMDTQQEFLKKLSEKETQKKTPASTIRVTPTVQWPVLDDTDNDVEDFFDRFDEVVDLANDGQGMSWPEKLRCLINCLKGNRAKTYRVAYKQARKRGEMQKDPMAVYVNIKEKLMRFVETPMEKETRILAEWDALHKGNLSALQFEPWWDKSLSDLAEVGLSRTERELFLAYLRKIGKQMATEIRKDQRPWPDGAGGHTSRRCCTWEEAHKVCIELEALNVDNKAVQHQAFAIDGADGPKSKRQEEGG